MALATNLTNKENNITQAVKNERTLVLANLLLARWEEVNSMVNLGYATSGIVHDMSGPLSVVRLNLEYAREQLQRQKGEKIDLLPPLTLALLGSEKLVELVETLKLAMVDSTIQTHFDVKTEIAECVALVTAQTKAKVAITCEPKNVMLFGSKPKFDQIIFNLLLNAAEHAKRITINISRTKQYVVALVSDNGPGIPKHIQQTLFEPFKSFGAGGTNGTYVAHLGLGLYTCKHIVEHDFDGKISVASSKENGTIFNVRLKLQALHKE